jgi:hypothetical protein
MYVPVQKGNLNLCVGETHLRVLSVSGGATYQMEGSVWKNLEATVGRGCFFLLLSAIAFGSLEKRNGAMSGAYSIRTLLAVLWEPASHRECGRVRR